MIGVFIDKKLETKKWIPYVFETVFSTLGLSYSILTRHENNNYPLVLWYGPVELPGGLEEYDDGKCVINIPYYENILKVKNKGNQCLYTQTMPPKISSYLKTEENKDLPFFYPCLSFNENSASPLNFYKGLHKTQDAASQIIPKGRGYLVEVGVDIMASIFYILSGLEEIHSQKRDQHHRFLADYSKIHNKNFLRRPLVNEYFGLMYRWINLCFEKKKIPLLQKWYWPDRKSFSVCLTHDVDHLKKWIWPWKKRKLAQSIRHLSKLKIKESKKNAGDFLTSLICKEDPYWNLEKITAIEDKYGFKSTFFFGGMGHKRDKQNPFDINYHTTKRKISNLIRKIGDKGWEVGLHGSYDSYNNIQKLKKEKAEIENIAKKKCKGIRQHFVRFERPHTWSLHSRLGFFYDSTLGYPDDCGFRAGLCHPYSPFDPQKEEPIPLTEIPFTFMDTQLMRHKNYSSQETFKIYNELIQSVKEHHGAVVLIWHNNVFDDKDFPGFSEYYINMLKNFYCENSCVLSCEQLRDWWERRNSIKLSSYENKKGHWQWVYEVKRDIQNFSFLLKNPENKNHFQINVQGTGPQKIIKEKDKTWIKILKLCAGDEITVEYVSS